MSSRSSSRTNDSESSKQSLCPCRSYYAEIPACSSCEIQIRIVCDRHRSSSSSCAKHPPSDSKTPSKHKSSDPHPSTKQCRHKSCNCPSIGPTPVAVIKPSSRSSSRDKPEHEENRLHENNLQQLAATYQTVRFRAREDVKEDLNDGALDDLLAGIGMKRVTSSESKTKHNAQVPASASGRSRGGHADLRREKSECNCHPSKTPSARPSCGLSTCRRGATPGVININMWER